MKQAFGVGVDYIAGSRQLRGKNGVHCRVLRRVDEAI